MGFRSGQMARTYWETLVRVRFSLITIAAMLALGYVTKYSGTDATLGLAWPKPVRCIPSSARCSAGSASSDRPDTRVQCPLRQSAKNHREQTGSVRH